MPSDSDFEGAVETVGRALNGFLSGDPTAFKDCWLQDDQVSIFGGRGAFETGWEEVGPRLDWASAGFVSGWADQEVLTSGSSGDVGFTVCIERGEVAARGRDAPAPLVLRVTHIYRRVAGAWHLVHRHADPVMGKIDTTTLLSPPAE